ncbi:unnamed protein product [Clonostachys byssicola]|uniref:6-phosphogluconate dehydrogenase NADP-binding domain-containing protein n=1 Tax=Clonostachys byssicola TaxID=160290 RepID=A0A9N9Y2J7_9HYPO|nr:unnamed protein product [Clonostachys byssicola]
MAPQLSWIGLGNMGRGMCLNLIQKGSLDKPLLVYNRTKKRYEDFVAQFGPGKATVSDSLEGSVSSADIIFTCLSNDAAVFETYESIVNGGNTKGKLFVDCSTLHPDSTDKVGKMMVDSGAEFVSSPVFGPPQMAEKGTLIFVTAGPRSSIERVRPFIKGIMGQAEIAFEDKPYSSAAKFKLIGNGFALNMVTQLAESFTLAEKAGVDPATVKQLVDMMYGGIYTVYSGRMLGGDYWKLDEPYFSAQNGLKDASHLICLSHAAGVELKNAATGREYLEKLAKIAEPDKSDITGIYGTVRKANGLKYENGS